MTEEQIEYVPPAPKQNGDIQVSNFYHLMDKALGSDHAIEVIERLFALKELEEEKAARRAYNTAMVKTQAEMPIVPRDAENKQTNSRYARLETLIKKAKPIYTAHGFSLSFYEGEAQKEGHVRLMVDVMHEAGHTETKWYDCPIDSAGIKGSVNKTPTHARASSDSYSRRYLTGMIFNIPTGDDDDGNAAGADILTEEQAANVEALIAEVKANRKKLLEYFGVGAVELLPASRYKEAVTMLERKRNA